MYCQSFIYKKKRKKKEVCACSTYFDIYLLMYMDTACVKFINAMATALQYSSISKMDEVFLACSPRPCGVHYTTEYLPVCW